MKHLTGAFFIIIIISLSCNEKYERKLGNVAGTWLLKRVEYQNSLGEPIVINDLGTTLTFHKINDGKKTGTSNKNGQLLNFEYSFDFSSSTCDLHFKVSDRMLMSTEAIGKVQVYNFRFVNPKIIEFYIDKEFDYSTKQVIKNIKYTFTKM